MCLRAAAVAVDTRQAEYQISHRHNKLCRHGKDGRLHISAGECPETGQRFVQRVIGVDIARIHRSEACCQVPCAVTVSSFQLAVIQQSVKH